MGNNLTVNVAYNVLDFKSDTASFKLRMPQFLINWHPFGGAFYIGASAGKETLEVEATDEDTGFSAKAEVSANTALARFGWLF